MIRRATVEDIPALDNLLIEVNRIHAKLPPDLFRDGRKKYTDEELAALMTDEDRPVFVFDADGKVLGYAFCIVLDHTKDTATTGYRTVYIDDLCIDSEARGRGIGHALYEHVLTYARGIGAYNVALNVWEGNASARRFYESIGMKVQKIGMETVL